MSEPTTKACTKCGETKPLDAFTPRRERVNQWTSSCKACQAATARRRRSENLASARSYSRNRYADAPQIFRAYQVAYHERNAEKRRASAQEDYAQKQGDTRVTARNHGKEWTGPELELAADRSRTTRDVATALGRTYAAVSTQRELLRTDPRKARMAGTDVEVTR